MDLTCELLRGRAGFALEETSRVELKQSLMHLIGHVLYMLYCISISVWQCYTAQLNPTHPQPSLQAAL